MVSLDLDLYVATASELQRLLSWGIITSVNLVNWYLDQIDRHNHHGLELRAVVATAPRSLALEEAERLDSERAEGKLRSAAHGIPILVKDNLCTSVFGLPTTSGSLALKGLVPNTDANIVTRLRDAGCIIIAKTNLSELGNMKGIDIMSGWSALGGQTQAPYVRGGVDLEDRWLGHSTPGGSSSGSAVGVAVGFAPWAIGVESDGSIVTPSLRAALYGMKATVGSIDMSGAQSTSNTFISSGGLTKSVSDLATLMSILIPTMIHKPLVPMPWKRIRIACVKMSLWRLPDSYCKYEYSFIQQSEREMNRALGRLERLGARVVRDVPLNSIDEFEEECGITRSSLSLYQCRPTLEKYLSLFDNPKLRTLEDLIQFNEDHAEEELPPRNSNQDFLKAAAQAHSQMSQDEFEVKMQSFRTVMGEKIEQCLILAQADFIMAPGDALFPAIAMAAGYPIACVPLGFAYFNGRPFGMLIIARANEERQMLELMAAWEMAFPWARKPPPCMSGQ